MKWSFVRAGAVALACGATAVGSPGAHAQPAPPALTGYTPSGSAHQQAYEARFQSGVSADDIGRLSRALSRRPHLVGTPNQQDVIDSSLAKLRSLRARRLDATLQTCTSSRPDRRQRQHDQAVHAAARHAARTASPWQRNFNDVVQGYNAFSPSGDVSTDVVYANYGLPERLRGAGQARRRVAGKIVLVRYGGSFRGVKVRSRPSCAAPRACSSTPTRATTASRRARSTPTARGVRPTRSSAAVDPVHLATTRVTR